MNHLKSYSSLIAKVLGLNTFQEQCGALDDFVKNTLGKIVVDASGGKIKSDNVVRRLDKAKDWIALYQPTVAAATIDNYDPA